MSEDREQNKKVDQTLQKGMFKDIYQYDKRHCTDMCCIIIGLLFTGALIIISFISINKTHVTQNSLPSDSSGKVCGIDYPKYSFLYFTNPPDITSRVCVSKCPSPGSSRLDCQPSGNYGCKFNKIPSFEVTYYQNEQVINRNGNFCMPKDKALRSKIEQEGNLTSRLLFFNSYQVFLLCILMAIGFSIFFSLLVCFSPRKMQWITIYSSLAILIGLAVVLFTYKTQNNIKILLAVIITVLFLFILSSIYFYSKQLQISGLYLRQSARFAANKPSTAFYIGLFTAFTLGFFFILTTEYVGLISVKTPTFDKKDIYYEPNKHGLWIVWVVLGIQLLWGLSFLKQAFNFCVSTHAILYYLKKGGGLCSITDTLSLLIFKHLGTVIAASFINIFLFIPDVIGDYFRLNKDSDRNCCLNGFFKVFDLVRSDALAFTALTGLSYCNSAKYCEYFNHESYTSQGTQSCLRYYRICAHILIAGIVSIFGFYIKGEIEPYTVCGTFIIGMFVSTYIISYQADPAQALQLMHNIQQQFERRSSKKSPVNIFDQYKLNEHKQWLAQKLGPLEENTQNREENAQ